MRAAVKTPTALKIDAARIKNSAAIPLMRAATVFNYSCLDFDFDFQILAAG
jgi:hypothetical protein